MKKDNSLTLSYNLNFKKDMYNHKHIFLKHLAFNIIQYVQGYQTLVYYNFFDNKRKDIWKRKELSDGKLMNRYWDYVSKDYELFKVRRAYSEANRVCGTKYNQIKHNFISYSKFILRNINTEIKQSDNIVLYKPKKISKKLLESKEKYPLNDLVIDKVSSTLMNLYGLSNDNVVDFLNGGDFNLLEQITISKLKILEYNPDFAFRRYFFRVDNSNFKISVPEKLSDRRVIKLMKRYNLVKYVYKKFKRPSIDGIDIPLIEGWHRLGFGKTGLVDLINDNPSNKSLLVLDKSIGNQYFLKLSNIFEDKKDIKFPIEYNAYAIGKLFGNNKYKLNPSKKGLSLHLGRKYIGKISEDNPIENYEYEYSIRLNVIYELSTEKKNIANILSYDLGDVNTLSYTISEINGAEFIQPEFEKLKSHKERTDYIKSFLDKNGEKVKSLIKKVKIKKQVNFSGNNFVEKSIKISNEIEKYNSLLDLEKNKFKREKLTLQEKEEINKKVTEYQLKRKIKYIQLAGLKKCWYGFIMNKLFEEDFDLLVRENLSFGCSDIKSMNKINARIRYGQVKSIAEYKSVLNTRQLFSVFSEYSSTLCDECLLISDKNRQSQEVFKCKNCGCRYNADLHGSFIIGLFALLGFISKKH